MHFIFYIKTFIENNSKVLIGLRAANEIVISIRLLPKYGVMTSSSNIENTYTTL